MDNKYLLSCRTVHGQGYEVAQYNSKWELISKNIFTPRELNALTGKWVSPLTVYNNTGGTMDSLAPKPMTTEEWLKVEDMKKDIVPPDNGQETDDE